MNSSLIELNMNEITVVSGGECKGHKFLSELVGGALVAIGGVLLTRAVNNNVREIHATGKLTRGLVEANIGVIGFIFGNLFVSSLYKCETNEQKS